MDRFVGHTLKKMCIKIKLQIDRIMFYLCGHQSFIYNFFLRWDGMALKLA